MWVSFRIQFVQWLSDQVKLEELEKETAEEYLRALEQFFDTFEIRAYEDLEKALRKRNYARHLCKALRKFIAYLKLKQVISVQEYEQLKEIIKLKRTKTRGIRIKTEELIEAWKYHRENSDEITQLFFKLLVFSGARLRAVHRMLTSFDKDMLIIEEKFAKYVMMERRGTKSTFYIYMPLELVDELRQVSIKEATIRRRIKYNRVSAITIRSWFSTYLSRLGVKDHVINYIQGRAPRSVLEEHYLDLELEADEAYSRVVDKLKEVLEVVE